MPKRKRKGSRKSGSVGRRRKRSKKAVHRRSLRKRSSRPTTNVIRGLGTIYPERLRVKLPYEQEVQLTSTAGATVDNVFRGNSLFDPDLTGAGAQPLGFDQLAAIYGIYRVFGSTFRLKGYPVAASISTQTEYALVPSVLSTSFSATNADWICEQPYSKRRSLNLTSKSFKSYMGTAKLWGEKPQRILYDPAYESLVSTNPINSFYWHAIAWPTDRTSTETTYIQIRVVYYAEFSSRLRLTQS